MFTKKLSFIILLVFCFLGFQKLNKSTPYLFDDLFRFPKKISNDLNPVSKEGALLGRYLFYDSILSKDYSISCASCHKQKFAFADNKKFSIGINGTEMNRNTLPLFNLEWYSSFFWDGRSASIENQALTPVTAHNEMNLNWLEAEKRINSNSFYKEKFKQVFGDVTIDSILITKAIGQFERTLVSNNSKYDKVIKRERAFSNEELNGFVLVNDQSMADCLQCHITDAHALGTNAKFANNGLDNELNLKDLGLYETTQNLKNKGKFKIPSLRNIALTAPYMHDGRFKSLEEVIDFYSEGVQSSKHTDSKMQYAHKGGVRLTDKEKADILAFLHTLTDSIFISNKEFSNPFR
ncbi:MAG: cytochrome-c peroxidase [Chitinophagales bacterium]